MKKIFLIIFLHHGIGDILMALPLLKLVLAKAGEEESVYVFVKSSLEMSLLLQLIKSEKLEIEVLNRNNPLSSLMAIRKRRPSFVLAPHAAKGRKIQFLSNLYGALLTVGPENSFGFPRYSREVPESRSLHKVEYYLEFAKEAGIETPESPDVRIELSSQIEEEALRAFPIDSQNEWVAFAPGSGVVEKHKRWPAGHFSKLGGMLLEDNRNLKILLLGSEDERDLLLRIQDGISDASERIFLVMPENILHSLVYLSKVKCLVSCCSGTIHMAAAVATPTVGLFGPTNPGYTGPYSKKIRIVHAGMSCSPCYRNGFIHGCGNPTCITSLTAIKVFEEINRAMRGEFDSALLWRPTTNASEQAN